jgi:hypothetical protein
MCGKIKPHFSKEGWGLIFGYDRDGLASRFADWMRRPVIRHDGKERRRNMNMVRSYQRNLFYCGIFVFFIFLQGCGSIAKEIKAEHAAKIEIGKSTKTDVLNKLGLPHKRELKSLQGAEKIECWIYYKGSGQTSVFIPSSVDPTPITNVYLIYYDSISIQERNKIAVIVIFDENGIVVDSKKGEE